MAVLTHEQRLLRNALINEAAARNPGRSYLEALSEGLRQFRETTNAGTAQTRRPSGPAGVQRQVAKATRKAVRARVREALTAAGAPKPPPGTGQAPAQPARRAAAPAKAPGQMSPEELEGALGSALATGTVSPFWQAMTESAPQGGVAETAPAAGKPLHQMDQDELRAATAAFATGGRSPFWAGAGND